MEDIPKPVWRAIEVFVVPYVINSGLGISGFPPEYTSGLQSTTTEY